MNPKHFLMGILLSLVMFMGFISRGQVKTVDVIAPPEIKLMPSPSRVIIFQDFNANGVQVAREKKEELIRDCTDTLLSIFKATISLEIPTVEFILVPSAEIDDSSKSPFFLLHRYQADLAFCIADFRPEVMQGEVTKTLNDDNSKSKSAKYSVVANGVLRIYNSDSLIKPFPFSESQFLQDRAVVSGVFAAGPSLVKNKTPALEVTARAAINLAHKFISQKTFYTVTLFKMKELKEVTYLIEQNNYDEALPMALQLASNQDEAISSRAHYLCAFLYHTQMDFPRAFEHAQQARQIKKLLARGEWTSYYYFLKKYVVDNQVVWKVQ
jgi:hypothetical protein